MIWLKVHGERVWHRQRGMAWYGRVETYCSLSFETDQLFAEIEDRQPERACRVCAAAK